MESSTNATWYRKAIKVAETKTYDAYIEAIESGDKREAERLVNEFADYALEKEFDRHYTGAISEDAYENYKKPGGLSWLGGKEKYPILLLEKDGIEYRQSGEKLKYTYYDYETGEHRRDSKGGLIYKPDEELIAEGTPLYDTGIIAFAGESPIGLASNEFGAVGIWVEEEYQHKGIGVTLLDEHMKQRKASTKIGQMTSSGKNMTRSWLRGKQDRSLVLYDAAGEIIPLTERFPI
jgi:GNAT superfamily N-acetyltransferase